MELLYGILTLQCVANQTRWPRTPHFRRIDQTVPRRVSPQRPQVAQTQDRRRKVGTAQSAHGKVPESHLTLYSLEVLGGLLFGLPGMISVGWFYRKQKKECEKQASVVGEIRDKMVWPPPPSK